MALTKKILIYQVLPRLFGNRNVTHQENGSIAENSSGKFNTFDQSILKRIHQLGFTHVWFTGVIRHATQTDYSAFGIPRCHSAVVKGKAGSPYSITDYYDVDPDLAENVVCRMEEWEALIARTHEEGMKVIIDFVPNHVSRQYHSISKPYGIKDLGEDDNVEKSFDPQNNFYYCVGQKFDPQFDLLQNEESPYIEYPAKVTGNDRFDAHPGINDWYEAVKLNYGVDYLAGRQCHFDPIPDTWYKMKDILLFWAGKGVDGFRCDMAEMVPVEFWKFATEAVKLRYPDLIFIGEVYDPNQYRNYIASGFDYLYDKVGMYDCLRGIIRSERPASSITYEWQRTDDIHDHMLYFLENHDEQRIASDFFCGNAWKAIPAIIVLALMRSNPFMLYSGQEFGERGMDKEGFSGLDGRTTIFDYWSPDTLSRAYSDRRKLTDDERALAITYKKILTIANGEKAIREGEFFDLMYVNPASWQFNPREQFAFIRKKDDEVILIISNFSGNHVTANVIIPTHAFEFLHLPEKTVAATDLLTGDTQLVNLKKDTVFPSEIEPFSGKIFKFSVKMNDNEYLFNDHNKDEFPPAHTAEHLLNQLMVRMFGCERSHNAHIERKKSKISYILDHKPSRQEEKEIERTMKQLIEDDLDVTYELKSRYDLPEGIQLDRLPSNAPDMVRLVRIGDYDVCPCIGKHVRSTGQIGKFVMLGTNWDEKTHVFRIRFKIVP